MSKSIASFTIDTDVLESARENIKNISGFINQALVTELKMGENKENKSLEDQIQELKIRNAKLSNDLSNAHEEIKKLKSKSIVQFGDVIE